MEPYNNDPARRRRLDPNDISAADQAGYIPRVGPPPADDGLPGEDAPTRAIPIPGAAPRREAAEDGRSPWARPADPPARPEGTRPPAANQPAPPAQGAPYIPARPRPQPEGNRPPPAPPSRTGWVPPEQIAAVETAAPPRPRGAGTPPAQAAGARPAAAAASQTGRGGALGWIAGVALGLLVLLLAGVFAANGWYEGQYGGRIFPGVRVLGEELGGKTPAEARDTLQGKIDAFIKEPVVVAWRDKEWRPRPEQLGLIVNLDRTIDDAYQVGRSGNLLTDMQTRWEARSGVTVPLIVGMDQGGLQEYLEKEVAPQVNQQLVEGEVWLQGEQIHTTEAKEGRELRVYEAVMAVTSGMTQLTTNRVELPVSVTVPRVTADEINESNRLLQTYLSGPFVGRAAGKELTLDRKRIAGLISLTRNPDPNAPRHYEIAWKDPQLQDIAANWAQEIDRAPQNARFDWNNGQVSVTRESQDGVQLQITDTVRVMKEALGTIDRRAIDLPVQTLTPQVSSKDLDKLGIKQEIGRGESTFAGSTEARVTNIRVGAGYLNGVVIPPGEEFSLLSVIAPIELDRGYVEGYVIAAERTQKGIGGGTCQVSTTAFRAFFWAGLDLVERNAHAYRVAIYEAQGEPVGFDAAVFDPGVDLKIINNTPGYILIKTSTDNNELNVYVYGTPVADEVKLIGPNIADEQDPPPDVYQLDPNLPAGGKRQVETARKGMNVTIGRQVIKDGQVIMEDSFFSHFQAWPNWYLVAPGVQTPSPPRPPDPTVTGN